MKRSDSNPLITVGNETYITDMRFYMSNEVNSKVCKYLTLIKSKINLIKLLQSYYANVFLGKGLTHTICQT